MKKILPFLFVIFYSVQLLFLASCANIIPPVGGPRDSLPPTLVKATPAENTRIFKGNRITLQFDEYVEVQNPFENVIISPAQEKFPVIDYKLRNVFVKIKDTLEPNTTYSIQFGNSIKDVNEGNILKNFTYIFSTGDTIDSLSLEGTVQIAETGKADSTLIVMLYNKLYDSAVAKEKPRYVTRIDGNGRFRFDYLPRGIFHVFALKDEGFKKYTNNKSLFAFADSTINIGLDNKPVNLFAFPAEKDSKKDASPQIALKNSKDDQRLKYELHLNNGEQSLLRDFQITFNKPLKQFDSTKFILTDTQSNVLNYKWQLDSTKKILSFQYPWKEKQTFKLFLYKDGVMDTSGHSLSKNDTIYFKTSPEASYGSVQFHLTGVDFKKHPMLQWVLNDVVYESYPLTGNEWRIKLFEPNSYEIRILYDENNNGVWDTGDYWKKKQPERVIAVPEKFNVRANWDNEFTVSL